MQFVFFILQLTWIRVIFLLVSFILGEGFYSEDDENEEEEELEQIFDYFKKLLFIVGFFFKKGRKFFLEDFL